MNSNRSKPSRMEDEVMLRTCKIWLREDGIARSIYFPNAEETLADAKEYIATVVKISKGKRCPLFVDIRKLKSITREAREYYAGEKTGEETSAIALLIGSPVSRIIGTFFLGLNKPSYPIKLFTSESEAIEWLKGFIE